HQQESQAATTHERRDVRDAGQLLDVPFDITGECLRFADVSAGREKYIDHELRTRCGREKAPVDFRESVQRSGEENKRQGYNHPAISQGKSQEVAVNLKEKATVRIAVFG